MLRIDLQVASSLYRKARELDCSHFRHWALRTIEGLFRYDAVLWMTSAPGRSPVLANALLSGLPRRFVLDLPGDKDEPIAAMQRTSTTEPAGSHFEVGCLRNGVRNHYLRYGIHDGLLARQVNASTGLVEMIAAFRFARGPALQPNWHELLGPAFAAIIDASMMNFSVALQSGHGLERRKTKAVITLDGDIVEAQETFKELLQRAYGGTAACLPFKIDVAADQAESLDCGLCYSWAPLENLAIVSLWSRSEVDGLTPREGELIEKVLLGLSDKEIAALLNLSPASVSNRLLSAFKKLNVAGRYQLRRKYFAADGDVGPGAASGATRFVRVPAATSMGAA